MKGNGNAVSRAALIRGLREYGQRSGVGNTGVWEVARYIAGQLAIVDPLFDEDSFLQEAMGLTTPRRRRDFAADFWEGAGA